MKTVSSRDTAFATACATITAARRNKKENRASRIGAMRSECSASAIVALLRTLLLGQGLTESHSREHDGFFIAAEDGDEVSVRFHEVERTGSSSPEHTRRHQSAIVELCDTLAQNRFTVTLFMSPRSLALFVRADEAGIADADALVAENLIRRAKDA